MEQPLTLLRVNEYKLRESRCSSLILRHSKATDQCSAHEEAAGEKDDCCSVRIALRQEVADNIGAQERAQSAKDVD